MEGSEKVAADIDRGENPGTRPGRPTQNAKPTTMSLRAGITTTYDLIFCITEHGWIGAGGGPVEDLLCLACFRVSVLLLLLMLISFLYRP